MKYQENKQKIYSFIDNELSSHEERTLYGHLSSCSMCMTEYNCAKDIDDLLQENIKHVEPPKNFADNVMNAITEESVTSNKEYSKDDFSDIPKNTSLKEKISKLKYNWLGWAAGIALAAYLGISSFGLNALQVADNKYSNLDNDSLLLEPQLLQQDVESNKPENNEQVDQTEDSGDKEVENVQQVSDDTAGDKSDKNSSNHKSSDDNIPKNANEQNVQNVDKNSNTDNNLMIASNDQDVKEQDISDTETNVQPQENTSVEENNSVDIDGSFQLAWDINNTSTIISEKVNISELNDVLHPTWTKDGQDIIFTAKNENGYTWYKLKYEEDELNKLVGPIAVTGIWSTETKKILFTSPNSNGNECIWTMGSNGGVKNVTPIEKEKNNMDLEGRRWAFNPVWSVKGEIAYLTERFGDTDIMITNSDGSNRRLTSTRESEKYPVWSPDGSKIAYYSYWSNKQTGEQVGQIVIQNSDGSNIKTVTPVVSSQSMVPTWSPNGKLLAVNVEGLNDGIWKASIDDNDWEKMSDQGGGSVISWSPDGKNIVFNDLKGKMFVLKYEASNIKSKLLIVQHAEGLSQDFDISWSPDGTRLLYEMKNPENNKNKIWIAKLPKSVSDY